MSDQERKEKFTPGPWFAAGTMVVDGRPSHSSPGRYSWDNEFREVCDCATFDIESEQVQVANAALIAAAPEMYELLDCIRKSVALDAGIMGSCIERIKPLLKKARGEE